MHNQSVFQDTMYVEAPASTPTIVGSKKIHPEQALGATLYIFFQVPCRETMYVEAPASPTTIVDSNKIIPGRQTLEFG